MAIKLRIEDRNGKASLWIDEWNVWDIPHVHVTDDVLSAIRHAWEIGRETAVQEMMRAAGNIGSSRSITTQWEDKRKRNT